MIYKPLSAPSVRIGDELRFIYATRVDRSFLNEGGVGCTVHLFQELIPKKFDLRLVVVGYQFFPVAIHASSDEARADWRSDYGALSYEPVDVPDGIRFR